MQTRRRCSRPSRRTTTPRAAPSPAGTERSILGYRTRRNLAIGSESTRLPSVQAARKHLTVAPDLDCPMRTERRDWSHELLEIRRNGVRPEGGVVLSTMRSYLNRMARNGFFVGLIRED